MNQQKRSCVSIFISSHSNDKDQRDELIKHLKAPERGGLIEILHHDQHAPGIDLAKARKNLLDYSPIILLLISPDYIACDDCWKEVDYILQGKNIIQAQLFPILLKHVSLEYTFLNSLQVLPRDGKSITDSNDQNAAWKEVADGIIKVAKNLDCVPTNIFPLPSLPIFHIPYSRNRFFTGRKDELGQIRVQLCQNHPIQAVIGLAGVGKTELAVEYAYRHKQDYENVLWAQANSVETFTSSYTEIAKHLKLINEDTKEQHKIVQVVRMWFANSMKYLLILDNVEEPELLKQFVPEIVGGHLLITTRNAHLSTLDLDVIPLKCFTPEEGVHFFKQIIKHETDHSEAKLLVRELGGLPLALDQANGYIHMTQTNLTTYLDLYQKEGARLLQNPSSSRYRKTEEVSALSVAATLNISFSKVTKDHPAAANLLLLCAFLAPDTIPEALLKKGAKELGSMTEPIPANDYQLNEAVEALRAYALIDRNQDHDALIVHRLLQKVLRDGLSIEDQHKWKQYAIKIVSAILPDLEQPHWTDCEKWLPHVILCSQWITENKNFYSTAPILLNWAGRYLRERARYDESKYFLDQADDFNKPAYEAMSLARANSLKDLGDLFWSQGAYEKAEKSMKYAQAIHEIRLKHEENIVLEEKQRYAECRQNLACVYQTLGEYKKSEELFQEFCAEEGDISDQTDKITAQANLAEVYRRQARYKEANSLLKQALYIHEQSENLFTAHILHKQALLRYDSGQYDKAKTLFRRTLDIYITCLGREHHNTAQIIHGLAEIYRIQGKYDKNKYEKSEKYFQISLNILEKELGKNHSATAAVLNGLALLYIQQGKYIYVEQKGCVKQRGYKKAKRLLRKALKIRKTSLTSATLKGLMLLCIRQGKHIYVERKGYMKQGRYKEAKRLLRKALKIRKASLGLEHPDTAICVHNLAFLYYALEMYKEAEEGFKQALKIWEKQLSAEHPYILHTLNHLGHLFQAQGNYKEANDLFQRLLEIEKRRFVQEDSEIILMLDDLAFLYYDQKRYEEAEVYFQRIIDIYDEYLGPEHPDTLTVCRNFTTLLQIVDEGVSDKDQHF